MEITITLPKKQFASESPETAAAKIKLYAALGLYQSGELSIGAACELAEVDRYAFLEILKREGITVQTQTVKELEKELPLAEMKMLGDPLLALAGQFESSVENVSGKHDQFIGENIRDDHA